MGGVSAFMYHYYSQFNFHICSAVVTVVLLIKVTAVLKMNSVVMVLVTAVLFC
jgi:hypothetical protein